MRQPVSAMIVSPTTHETPMYPAAYAAADSTSVTNPMTA